MKVASEILEKMKQASPNFEDLINEMAEYDVIYMKEQIQEVVDKHTKTKLDELRRKITK
jgi:uncharacterized iron-regulated protein